MPRALVPRLLVAGIVAAYLSLYLATLSDYGVTWDSAAGELYVGDQYLQFITTLDPEWLKLEGKLDIYSAPDHPDYEHHARYIRVHRSHAWGFGPMVTSATKAIFYTWLHVLDPIDAHHVALGILVALQMLVVYRLLCGVFGPAAGIGAILCLAIYPRYWAHAHNNPKDVVEAVLYTCVLYVAYRALVLRSPGRLLAAGALSGLALATKANAYFLPIVVLPAAIHEMRRRGGFAALWDRRMLLALAGGVVLAAVLMLLGWPLLLVDFPHYLIDHYRYLIARGATGPDSFQLRPLVNLFATMPIGVLVLLLAGLGGLVVAWRRHPERRTFVLLAVTWLVLPVLRVSLPRAVDFDGIRHWLEVVPAVCVVAGVGVSSLLDLATARYPRIPRGDGARAPLAAALTLLLLSQTVLWDVKNHPFQVVYYSPLVGGLQGAQAFGWKDAGDYWGSSYHWGIEWLNRNTPEGATVIIGVGEHIGWLQRKTRLRKDLKLETVRALPFLMGDPSRKAIYLMYVTRPTYFDPKLSHLPPGAQLMRELRVDGAPILRIERLR